MLIINVAMVIVLCCSSAAVIPAWAENNPPPKEEKKVLAKNIQKKDKTIIKTPPAKSEENNTRSFLDIFNNKAYAAPVDENEEKNKLRREWEELTGVDIFYPYFKAKEIEDWASEKVEVKLFKMRGRLKLSGEKNQIKYTFSIKF